MKRVLLHNYQSSYFLFYLFIILEHTIELSTENRILFEEFLAIMRNPPMCGGWQPGQGDFEDASDPDVVYLWDIKVITDPDFREWFARFEQERRPME